MAREGLVACALGFATGGVGTYALHRALWKCADAQARAIEALLPAEVRARSAAEDAAVAAARTRAEKMVRREALLCCETRWAALCLELPYAGD
jgi:hypothetical protein